MKTKLEEFFSWAIKHKCAVCGCDGKYDIWLSGTYDDNKEKQTINCRNCNGRLS
ncbi:MAG TPA: hypothetical protein VLA48_02045 [Nitrososphaeraceae archaeon]|nr:hypothetical protein [Nitrososphaeraceae archaeon]